MINFLDMPNLPLLVEQAQRKLAEEKAMRDHFYKTVDENTKMEFINGQIVFQSPVKKRHNDATGRIFKVLSLYVELNDLGWVGIEKVLVSLTRNDYEPDVCFWKKERSDLFTDEQMQFPAPDLVVEVLSPKTAKIDKTIKYVDYEAHGVSEYWIVDPKKQEIEQYVLKGERYELAFKGSEGTLICQTIEGLQLDVSAAFDKTAMNKTLASFF